MKCRSLALAFAAIFACTISVADTTASHRTISGSCKGDCVNGTGTLTVNGEQYTGAFSAGVMHGPAEVRNQIGDTLIGTMVNGQLNGSISITTADGHQFVQEYIAGTPTQGTSIRSNGDIYEGSFQKVTIVTSTAANESGHSSGQLQSVATFNIGRYTTTTGDTYTGTFSLADGRMVFHGSKSVSGNLAGRGHYAAAFIPGTRNGYSFEPVTQEEVTHWKSTDESRISAIKPQTPSSPATGQASAANRFNPIENNTGRYLSPITSDGVAAAWVDKAVNASLGSSVGGLAGAYAGQKALEQVPFVGGFLGRKAGAAAGRGIALKAVGGEAYLRETSDLSFNDINDMARWLVQNHATHARFAEIMKAAGQIYPELTPAYISALRQR